MASAQGIKAGSAYVELIAKDGSLVKGLDNAGKRLRSFGTIISGIGAGFAAAGAAITAPLAAMTKSFAENGAAMYDMVKRTGISAEELSKLKYAASQTGTDMAALEAGVRKMQKTITAAGQGSASAAEAFGVLGLNIKELAALSPDQQFRAIAEALSQIPDPTERAALAMQVFGTALLPMLEKGAAGLDEFGDKAKRLGLVTSTESVTAAKALNVAFSDLSAVMAKTAGIIGSALAGTFKDMAETATAVIVRFNQWVKANKDLVVEIFQVAKVVGLVGTAIVGLGAAGAALGVTYTAIASAITGVLGLFGTLTTVIVALLNPVALLTIGVAGLGAYLVYVSGIGARALAALSQKFVELKTTATDTFKGIADALAAGDIKLAAEILWSGLQLAWLEGTAELRRVWSEFQTGFVRVAAAAFYGAAEIWTKVSSGLQAAWARSAAAFKSVWGKAISETTGLFEQGYRIWMKKQVDVQVALGKLTKEKGEEQKKFIDEQFAKQTDVRKSEEARAEQDSQQKLAADLAGIEQKKQATIAELTKAEMALSAAASSNSDAEKAELTQRIANLKKQLADLGKTAEREKSQTQGSRANPQQVKNNLSGLPDVLNQAEIKFSSRGTFNALEARGLAGGDSASWLAEAKKQSGLLKDIYDRLNDMDGGEFQ